MEGVLSGGLWRQRVAVANEEMSPLEVRMSMDAGGALPSHTSFDPD